MNKRELFKKHRYNTSEKIFELEGFKFGFETEYGRDLDYLNAIKLHEKFGGNYRAACGMLFVLDYIDKQKRASRSLDEMIVDLTDNLESYKRLIKKIMR